MLPADGEDERLDAPRHPKDEALGKREQLRFGSSLVIERADFHDPETDGAAPAGFNRLVAGGRVRAWPHACSSRAAAPRVPCRWASSSGRQRWRGCTACSPA